MDLVGITGKTNTGKTTAFSAATLVDAKISNRTFTTIKPNQGVGWVRSSCPCKKLHITCNPQNSRCEDGTRLIPIKLLDLPGLIPGAHEGKGLGNDFLDKVMRAKALIHIVDISGSTDKEGKLIGKGEHDPLEDIQYFEQELNEWIKSIVKRNLGSIKRLSDKIGLEKALAEKLIGLGIEQAGLKRVLHGLGNPSFEELHKKLLPFSHSIRKQSKPTLIAANKIDVLGSNELLKSVKRSVDQPVVECCAEAELALRRAAEKGLISYTPGSSDFAIRREIQAKKKKALEWIKSHVLERFGSTGIQQILDKAIYNLLNYIVVYPVESEKHFTDKDENVLPDAILLKQGSTAYDLAKKVHTEIAERMTFAIDAISGERIARDQELKDGDIIKIVMK